MFQAIPLDEFRGRDIHSCSVVIYFSLASSYHLHNITSMDLPDVSNLWSKEWQAKYIVTCLHPPV